MLEQQPAANQPPTFDANGCLRQLVLVQFPVAQLAPEGDVYAALSTQCVVFRGDRGESVMMMVLLQPRVQGDGASTTAPARGGSAGPPLLVLVVGLLPCLGCLVCGCGHACMQETGQHRGHDGEETLGFCWFEHPWGFGRWCPLMRILLDTVYQTLLCFVLSVGAACAQGNFSDDLIAKITAYSF